MYTIKIYDKRWNIKFSASKISKFTRAESGIQQYTSSNNKQKWRSVYHRRTWRNRKNVFNFIDIGKSSIAKKKYCISYCVIQHYCHTLTTAHSALKLPLKPQFSEDYTCNIKKYPSMSKVLQQCEIIVLDEWCIRNF